MGSIKTLLRTKLAFIYKYYYKRQCQQAMKYSAKEVAEKLHQKYFKRKINWENPQDLNEKIRWMQFNTNTDIWSLLADKYAVRKYIQSKGYDDILIKLYGKWDKAEDIDFNLLPKSFVLKTNHGSGEIIIVKNKNKANLHKIKKQMQHYLETPFGIISAEPHYLKIKPCIIAEELLTQDGEYSSSLIDYKFFCFHGIPTVCGVFYDRDLKNHQNGMTPYDMNWNKHEEWRKESLTAKFKDIPCPKNFNRMKQACQDLAEQFPFVRLDFYEVNGHFYFGEFTFTPAGLTGGSFTDKKMKELGQLIQLPNQH